MADFTHLHVHTQYSILDGACNIKKLVRKTKELGMDTLAITDHGAMYGVLDFRNTCVKEGIKPILGCEMYVVPSNRFDKNEGRGHHLILLAKNEIGYKNLIKLDSLGFDPQAFYYNSRIDKELLFKYHEGLICSSACVAGIIPRLLYANKIEEAEEVALEYKEVFKDDYYIELQNFCGKNELQNDVNPKLIALANKLDIKLIATNDVHFINKEDFFAHRILICLSTGTTINKESKLLYSGEEYLKTPDQMAELFKDVPQAIENTREVANKIEEYELERGPILPVFDIPLEFGKIEDYYEKFPLNAVRDDILDQLVKRNKVSCEADEQKKNEAIDKSLQDKGGYDKIVRTKFDFAYLRHLTYEGAAKRYPMPLDDKVRERIDMELDTIEWMGFPGYFLIVQDFINQSREKLGVVIGPGRGSAAGSVVAYCLGITQIEPMKYDLLFERFLNPDRISLPDIDVDFDDEGRARTLKYVQDKYGASHVAQITTFGTMAAKMSIKDVARVLELPLQDANRLASYVPTRPGITLDQAIQESPELQQILQNGNQAEKDVLRYAMDLEGSIRSTGVHACGIIIGPDDISNYVPLAKPKDSDMMAVQFEGKLIESVGMIKMDFLGLSNLSIIKDACENVYKSTGQKIDIDNISLEDKQTLELFASGNTTATFQFESEGMKNHLRNLKPDKFEDLIAMNALYRPGPMAYIPDFIKRKHGEAKIEYEFPQMEKYLKDTYGITVYQEQVMQLSRVLANFTPGEADTLRKAMGKKKMDVMAKMKEKFDNGCQANGLDKTKTEKIWNDWVEFAKYAFNKSHATCYAYVAFQTGYLKAHYPAEYMSAVLTHNKNNPKNLTLYIADCQNMDIDVLGPNVNESDVNFMVNKKGQILFGLGAIKNVGEKVVENVIEQRKIGGEYSSAEDFITRNLSVINRKSIESLVLAGAFDCFKGIDRAQYIAKDNGNDVMFIEKLIKYCQKKQMQASSSQFSLFGEEEQTSESNLSYPNVEPMTLLDKLRYERDLIGFYVSGHPLDDYTDEIKTFVYNSVTELDHMEELYKNNKTSVSFAGIVTKAEVRTDKQGKQFGIFTLEDKEGTYEFALFRDDFLEFGKYLRKDLYLYIKGKLAPSAYMKQNETTPRVRFYYEKIELLESMFQQFAANIKITIDNTKITEDFVENITLAAKNHKGNCDIVFVVYDYKTNVRVTLESTKYKVDVSTFIKELKPLCKKGYVLDYVVNTKM
ncbi:MAG: DNA polymerase III subunit alpha [Bacteroidales bacterium]|nr:DNA polymerase III subunit alpha [Bacteroidales bacterium]